MKKETQRVSTKVLATPLGIWIPAHVKEMNIKDFSRNGVDKKIFELIFIVASEAEKLVLTKTYFENGEREETKEQISGKYLVGRKLKSKGIFYTIDAQPEDEWMNIAYTNWFKEIGVQFKQDPDDEEFLLISEVEEEDVLGKACLVLVTEDKPFTSNSGEEITPLVVTGVKNISDVSDKKPGEMLDESDVPF